eukprot:6190896-Pleurochrysis_carterae.AAC.2
MSCIILLKNEIACEESTLRIERKVRVPHCKEEQVTSIEKSSSPRLSLVGAKHEEKPRVWRAEKPRGGATKETLSA